MDIWDCGTGSITMEPTHSPYNYYFSIYWPIFQLQALLWRPITSSGTPQSLCEVELDLRKEHSLRALGTAHTQQHTVACAQTNVPCSCFSAEIL